ncbi:MAG: four helix bundle suffix domain-containing protein [Patescibacteria group bacterium]|nr:four helix bundle suffix domain-containing protein [Patescibacteria group bacterium]
MLPKYKYLLTYRYSLLIHDLTVEFTLKFMAGFDYRRSREQMVQAARSGKQNIVEGVGQSLISKKGEIKLLGVANASLEELLSDYEDFLRQHSLEIWPKTDIKISNFRKIAYRLSVLANLSNLGEFKEKPKLSENPEEAANFLLTLCHQATFLLSRQIAKMEEIFIREGGYSENLFKKRLNSKIK